MSATCAKWSASQRFAGPYSAPGHSPTLTGLPFVYAFWAGRPDVLSSDDVAALQRARDEGVGHPAELAREYLTDRPDRHEIGARYLRDNIQYYLGEEERAGLERFYRYAAEAGCVERALPLQFY